MKQYIELPQSSYYKGKMYEKNFSTFTLNELCKIEFDILEQSYKLTSTLIWFQYYSRKRENERITVMAAISSVYIDIDTMNQMPLFQRHIKHLADNEEKFTEEVLKMIRSNPVVMKALVERYHKELGKNIYVGKNIEYVLGDRWCSKEELVEKFFELNKEELSNENLINELNAEIERSILNM